MVDQSTNNSLYRFLKQVKKLSPDVTLDNYYSQIKPFLFGTTDRTPIPDGYTPEQGIYKVAKNGKLSPSTSEILVKIENGAVPKYEIANIYDQQFLHDLSIKKKDHNKFIFPSDLISILTDLAQIFRKGNTSLSGLKLTYNATGLAKFDSGSNHLHFVTEWGKPSPQNSNAFKESYFETNHAGDIAALLEEVNLAAREFENVFKEIDKDEFKTLQELINDFAIPEIASEILNNFNEYNQKVKPLIASDPKFNEASNQIIQQINEYLNKNQDRIFDKLFTQKTNLKYVNDEIADLKANKYLWTTRNSDGKDGVKQSTEYLEFLKQTVADFLKNNEEKLARDFISPLFIVSTEETEKKDPEDDKDDDNEGEAKNEEDNELFNNIDKESFFAKLSKDLNDGAYQKLIFDYVEKHDEQINFLFSKHRTQFELSYRQQLLEDIQINFVEPSINVFEFSNEILEELKTKNLFSKEGLSQNIYSSEWYLGLLKTNLDQLNNTQPPINKYNSYFEYLFEYFIIPVLNIIESNVEEDKPETPEEKPEDLHTATVPSAITPDTRKNDDTKPTSKTTSQINQDNVRSIQFEAAWMYRLAIINIYNSEGLTESEIDPQILQQLRNNVIEYVASMPADKRFAMFANEELRENAFENFFRKYQAGSEYVPAETIFQRKLSSILEDDSPTLYKNAKNTIDTLVQQYGVNESYLALDPNTLEIIEFEGENKKDALWFINALKSDKIELIFNLKSGILKNNQKKEDELKELLFEIAKKSWATQSLHTYGTTLQNGLIVVTAEDARAIENGNEAVIKKHLSFTTVQRSLNKQHGSETVAGAADNKKTNNRKEALKKQYEMFLPLWGQLSGTEQAEIYKKYGLGDLIPKDVDLGVTKLDFHPDLVGFDISDLNKIRKIIKHKDYSKEKKQSLLDLLSIQDQLIKEEALGDFLISSQEYYSDESEIYVITQMVGVDSSYRERFTQEQELYDEYGEDYGTDHPASNNVSGNGFRGRLKKRFSNSRIGKAFNKRFGKKLDPLTKAKKTAKNAIGSAATKIAATGANLVIPGVGALIMAIPNKKLRDFVSYTVLGGLTALISTTLYALGSIGGIIGAAIGGIVAGIVSGGTMIIPASIAGAHIGNAILPTRWTTAIFGPNTISPYSAANPANIAAAKAAADAQAAAVKAAEAAYAKTQAFSLTSISIGILAPAGALLFMVFTTLYTMLVIQSAFLIPVPQERLSVGFSDVGDGVGGLGIDDCKDFGKPLPFDKNEVSPISGRAYDIVNNLMPGFWCYWNWHPEFDGLQADLQSLDTHEQDLFDEILYKQHPNHCIGNNSYPPGCTGDAANFQKPDQLFWCTWLVNKAYQQNYSTGANAMSTQFKTWPGHIFIPANSISWEEVKPGDVAFIKVLPDTKVGHVAIVHNVEQDFITTVDSNAYSRYNQYTVGSDGKVQATKYFEIAGFGRKIQ